MLPGQDRRSLALQALEATDWQETVLFAQGTGAHPQHEPRQWQPQALLALSRSSCSLARCVCLTQLLDMTVLGTLHRWQRNSDLTKKRA